MTKQLKCPACGAIGESGMAALGQNAAFEIRGQWQGKPVRMCNGCGSGFTVGIFGNKRIDDVQWGRMKALWGQNFG